MPEDLAENGQRGHPDLVKHRLRLQPEIQTLAPKVHSIVGLSLANCHCIEGSEGLIIVDSGHGAAEGSALRKLIRSISDQPIAALLYTHSHYVHGSETLLDGDKAVVVGHPRLNANVRRSRQISAAATSRRIRLETGAILPQEGSNAAIAPAPNWRGDSAYCEPTHSAVAGDHLDIAGIQIDILAGCFDTDDGLSFAFPKFDTVAHNLVVGQLPNFGSLGGGRYRDPLPWLQAVAHLAENPPQILLPCHGLPLTGRERISERLRVNHQAIHHCFHAVINGLADGATVPDLIRDIGLPADLRQHEDLRELYGCVAHLVAAIAVGEMGFWSGEARDLLPLHPDDEAQHLAQALGGVEQLMLLAAQAHQDGNGPWALHLADAALRLQHPMAAPLRAQILQQTAYNCPTWTLRNTLLSIAHNDNHRAS